jgi:hypothetical protein
MPPTTERKPSALRADPYSGHDRRPAAHVRRRLTRGTTRPLGPTSRSRPGSLVTRAAAMRRVARLHRAGIIDGPWTSTWTASAPTGYHRMTLQTKRYARQAWTEHFDLLDHIVRDQPLPHWRSCVFVTTLAAAAVTTISCILRPWFAQGSPSLRPTMSSGRNRPAAWAVGRRPLPCRATRLTVHGAKSPASARRAPSVAGCRSRRDPATPARDRRI